MGKKVMVLLLALAIMMPTMIISGNVYAANTNQADKQVNRAEVASLIAKHHGNNAVPMIYVEFKDVEDSRPYANDIHTVAALKYMQGIGNGYFMPAKKITRAEIAMIVSRIKEMKNKGEGFKDVKGHWAENAIKLCQGNDIIKGDPDGTFKPNQNVTKKEVEMILDRAYKEK